MLNFRLWKMFDEADKELYREICALMEIISDDVGFGNDRNGNSIRLSSHIAARAFANALPGRARCVDGFFAGQFQHAWLETDRHALIDVFPSGAVGQPLLFWNHPKCKGQPVKVLYHPDRAVAAMAQQRIGTQQFDRAVCILTDLICARH